MSIQNEHIKQFIQYYCELDVAPEYALLIKGPWGCGKTHLIQNRIDELENSGFKFLYVSLYGLANIEDIETKFFQLLNPVLSSKSAILAGRFAKGLLKGAFKIDLDDDGKPDGTVSPSIPEINLSDYLTDTTNSILVFDDVERCNIELKSLLGFMNYFVEKEGYKVILIADEEKLFEDNTKDENNKSDSYDYIKEKLIGKTLEVESDGIKVYEQIVESTITDTDLQDYLLNEKEHFINIYTEADYKNLRSLRKTLLDIGRIWNYLDDEVKAKKELITKLFSMLFVLSMEIYSGQLRPKEIRQLIGDSTVSRILRSNNDNPDREKFIKLSKKYSIDLFETIISTEDLEQLFSKGHLSHLKLNESLKSTYYFLQNETPAWIQLWHIWEIEEEAFQAALESVNNDYQTRQFIIPGEIKHIGGILLMLSEHGLIDKDKATVVSEHKAYIDDVFSTNQVSASIDSPFDKSELSSYGNLQFTSKGSPEFLELSEYLEDHMQTAKERTLKERAKEILEIINNEPDKLIHTLCHSNHYYSPLASLPALKHITTKDFSDIYLKQPNKVKREIPLILQRRYSHMPSNSRLVEEKSFVRVFRLRLKRELRTLQPGPTKLIIQGAIENLDSTLELFS